MSTSTLTAAPQRRPADDRGPGLQRLRRDPLVRALLALRPNVGRTLLAVAAGTAALGCAIGLMATSGWLISRAAQQPPVLSLQVAVVATRAFGIGRGVLRYVERLISHDVALRGVVQLRERLYLRLAAADPAVVAGLRRGDLLARVGADVDALADVVVRSLLPFGVAVVTSLGSAVLVAWLLPPAGLAVAAGLALAAVVAPWLAAVAARRAEQDAARARVETSAEVLALLDGAAELTVAGAVRSRLTRLARLDDALAGELDRAARPAALAAGLSTLMTGLAMVAALALGVQAVRRGSLDEVLLAVVALTPLAAAEAVSGLPAAATGLVRARTAAERVLQLLEAPPATPPATATATPSPTPSPSLSPSRDQVAGKGCGVRPGAIRHPSIRAEQLACGWPGAAPVLTGFDLDLPPGRRVAIVGGSGCGKTTLLVTLAGLLPRAGGGLTLGGEDLTRDGEDLTRDGKDLATDGEDLATIDPQVVRRTVSFTAEDAHIFTTTVRENLRVADPGADDTDVRTALVRAGLGTWLGALPDGLDTMLGSGGTGLSGGERRRLLLARTFLVGAGVLLLDEPGEHLDPQTADALVYDVLTGGTTPGPGPAVVLVTHRLAPLAAADEVIVLDSGAVAARGTHAWLLAHHDSYRDAWAAEQGVQSLPGEQP